MYFVWKSCVRQHCLCITLRTRSTLNASDRPGITSIRWALGCRPSITEGRSEITVPKVNIAVINVIVSRTLGLREVSAMRGIPKSGNTIDTSMAVDPLMALSPVIIQWRVVPR